MDKSCLVTGKWRGLLAFLCVVLVLILTHLPPQAMPESLPWVLQLAGSDKVEHGIAYALITTSCLFAAKWPGRRWALLITAIGVAALGAADELTQPFVTRDCSGWDWMADLAGIAMSCGVVLLRSPHRRGLTLRGAVLSVATPISP
jgi:hypothetical protein